MEYLHKKIILRVLLIALSMSFFSQTLMAQQAYVGGQCTDVNGMYVSLGNGATGILGNTAKENALLNFSRDNGINYLIMYDLEGLSATSTRANQLASLIYRAKHDYNIHQVGAALGSAASADVIVNYNNQHSYAERIDVLNLEYEFWNQSNRQTAFNNSISILNYFKSVATANDLETEVYIGWITAAEGEALGNAADRILVHFYRTTDQNIIDYGLERLQYLAAADRKVRIAPIFSNEGPTNTGDPTSYFMGPWLNTHPNDQAFKTWIAGYNAINASWKNNLEIMGSTWFLYNYFSAVNVNSQNHITSNPTNQTACIGDTVTFNVASSAANKNYCWMKNGSCLANNEKISGANTASLTISNINNSDFADYSARIISYDASNPASYSSLTATLAAGTNCDVSQNIALNKTVTASSFIAAGYEPYRTVDGNTTSSRWASAYTGRQWLQVDLGAQYPISRVRLIWEAAYAINYNIQVSNNGANWTTLRSISGNHDLINDNTDLAGYGRYVRINSITKALPQWGFSLFEIEVYSE